MVKGWADNNSTGVSAGASSSRTKGFRPTPAPAAQPAYSAPAVVSNSSGNYQRPSAPPAQNPGPIAPIAPPAPAIPTINAYLGHDTTYLNQQREFQNALANYLAQEKQQRGKLTEDYGGAQKALNDQKGIDLGNIQSDFASRGLLTSGLFADANSQYNTSFLQKLAELTKNQQRGLADLTSGETDFRKNQSLESQRAREQAIARRASKYGL
jgi:hypothetical protein